MKYFVLFTTIFANTLAHTQLYQLWDNFKVTHNKEYLHMEEIKRLTIFKENLEKIENHNKWYNNGKVSYKMDINQFADLTQEEFINYINRFKNDNNKPENLIKYEAQLNENLPAKIDWRDKGAVTAIKDQKDCGSCWSFSATGSLEGRNFLKNGKLVSLSEQELVDCSISYGNEGCGGGLMDSAFRYVITNGLASEKDYPYEAIDDTCRKTNKTRVVKAKSLVEIKQTENDLKSAVANKGPISVAVDASGWQFYSSGIYNVTYCGSNAFELNHGVLAVGYGTEKSADYWLIKNSWGTSWGDKGYMKLVRNQNNKCGIATESSYPNV